MLTKRGSGGAFGSGSGRFGSRSGGVGLPAGAFGSKKPSGLGRLAIRSMFFAASPASRKPAFRPTRGSFVAGAAGVCCAAPRATAHATSAEKHIVRMTVDLISLTPSVLPQAGPEIQREQHDQQQRNQNRGVPPAPRGRARRRRGLVLRLGGRRAAPVANERLVDDFSAAVPALHGR